MPWCELPPDRLVHLPMFGHDLLHDDGMFVWAHGPKGRTRIEKACPRVWFEDMADAVQAGAVAILQV